MAKITFDDKVKFRESEKPRENSVFADDLNQIKESTNRLYDLTGWGLYSDTEYDVDNKLTIVADTLTLMPNNAGSTVLTQLPLDSNGDPLSLYDGSLITPENAGDGYMMRINFESESLSANTWSEIKMDIGGSEGVIFSDYANFPKPSESDHKYSFTFLYFSLGTFVSNGGQIKMQSNNNIDIWNISYLISRFHYAR